MMSEDRVKPVMRTYLSRTKLSTEEIQEMIDDIVDEFSLREDSLELGEADSSNEEELSKSLFEDVSSGLC